MRVIAQARDGLQALKVVLELRPDVLIADIEMPEMTGLELAEALPRSIATRIIILTTFARPGYLQRALEAGVRGFVLKDSPSGDLAETVRRVHAGDKVVNPRLAAEAVIERDPLTEREREVLQLAGSGASSGDIAQALRLSKGTVEIISLRPSRNSKHAIGSMPRALPSQKAGCRKPGPMTGVTAFRVTSATGTGKRIRQDGSTQSTRRTLK